MTNRDKGSIKGLFLLSDVGSAFSSTPDAALSNPPSGAAYIENLGTCPPLYTIMDSPNTRFMTIYGHEIELFPGLTCFSSTLTPLFAINRLVQYDLTLPLWMLIVIFTLCYVHFTQLLQLTPIFHTALCTLLWHGTPRHPKGEPFVQIKIIKIKS